MKILRYDTLKPDWDISHIKKENILMTKEIIISDTNEEKVEIRLGIWYIYES